MINIIITPKYKYLNINEIIDIDLNIVISGIDINISSNILILFIDSMYNRYINLIIILLD